MLFILSDITTKGWFFRQPLPFINSIISINSPYSQSRINGINPTIIYYIIYIYITILQGMSCFLVNL
jgi:hypothetical protein